VAGPRLRLRPRSVRRLEEGRVPSHEEVEETLPEECSSADTEKAFGRIICRSNNTRGVDHDGGKWRTVECRALPEIALPQGASLRVIPNHGKDLLLPAGGKAHCKLESVASGAADFRMNRSAFP
jgi:hypothetical protein